MPKTSNIVINAFDFDIEKIIKKNIGIMSSVRAMIFTILNVIYTLHTKTITNNTRICTIYECMSFVFFFLYLNIAITDQMPRRHREIFKKKKKNI